jgi:hypothetical protein
VPQLPFAIYLCLLLILYIYNGHKAENKIREIERLTRENKELRSEYISIFSQLMNESRQSNVARKLAPFGLKELKEPPKKISVNVN